MSDSTPIESAPAATAAPPPLSADATPNARVPMHAAVCGDCGVPFTLPAALYLRRLEERGHIYCPVGHLIELRPDNLASGMDVVARAITLTGELAAARQMCQELRDELARRPAPPAGPVTPEELKRRVRLLQARSERAEYGRVICNFCGKKISGNDYNVRQHLTRNHAPEIGAMPPKAFD